MSVENREEEGRRSLSSTYHAYLLDLGSAICNLEAEVPFSTSRRQARAGTGRVIVRRSVGQWRFEPRKMECSDQVSLPDSTRYLPICKRIQVACRGRGSFSKAVQVGTYLSAVPEDTDPAAVDNNSLHRCTDGDLRSQVY